MRRFLFIVEHLPKLLVACLVLIEVFLSDGETLVNREEILTISPDNFIVGHKLIEFWAVLLVFFLERIVFVSFLYRGFINNFFQTRYLHAVIVKEALREDIAVRELVLILDLQLVPKQVKLSHHRGGRLSPLVFVLVHCRSRSKADFFIAIIYFWRIRLLFNLLVDEKLDGKGRFDHCPHLKDQLIIFIHGYEPVWNDIIDLQEVNNSFLLLLILNTNDGDVRSLLLEFELVPRNIILPLHYRFVFTPHTNIAHDALLAVVALGIEIT